jgi:hypothetical protein
VVTGDRANLARALALVVGGAACVVAIGWLFGLLVPVDVVAETNSQVNGRVHPKLIDLVAALATGAVGSFALVRSDVSRRGIAGPRSAEPAPCRVPLSAAMASTDPADSPAKGEHPSPWSGPD